MDLTLQDESPYFVNPSIINIKISQSFLSYGF